MTQLSDTQPMRIPALRLSAKIRGFQEGLTAEERMALDLAIRRVIAGAHEPGGVSLRTGQPEDEFGFTVRRYAEPRTAPSSTDILTTIGVIAGVILLDGHPGSNDAGSRSRP